MEGSGRDSSFARSSRLPILKSCIAARKTAQSNESNASRTSTSLSASSSDLGPLGGLVLGRRTSHVNTAVGATEGLIAPSIGCGRADQTVKAASSIVHIGASNGNLVCEPDPYGRWCWCHSHPGGYGVLRATRRRSWDHWGIAVLSSYTARCWPTSSSLTAALRAGLLPSSTANAI